MKKLVYVFLFLVSAPLWGADSPSEYNYLTEINCRIGERTSEGISIITESDLDTTSKDPDKFSFTTNIHDGKKITTYLKHVQIALPGDRFMVTLKLDNEILLRISHIDLDLYLEQTIDGHRYLLHCMPPIR